LIDTQSLSSSLRDALGSGDAIPDKIAFASSLPLSLLPLLPDTFGDPLSFFISSF